MIGQKKIKSTNGNRCKGNTCCCSIIADKKVDAKNITPSGSNGKILKHDVLNALI